MTLFSGSIDESMVPLSHFSSEDKTPYLLLDEKQRRFVLAAPSKPSAECKSSIAVARTAEAEVRSRDGKTQGEKKTIVEVGELCDGSLHWNGIRPFPVN